MSNTWLPRELALALAVTGFLIGGWFGYSAIGLGITSSWPTQESPWIVVVPNTGGTWEPKWEPTWRGDRARPLFVRYERPWLGETSPDLGLSVRVEPLEALDDGSRARAGTHGWIQNARGSVVLLGIDEPALVRRIEWKIGSIEPSLSAPPFQLCVPGNPDSVFPGLWPYYAAVSFFALTISSLLVWWARKSGSGARRATFDLI